MMANTLPPGTLLKNSSYASTVCWDGRVWAIYLATDLILEKQCAIRESQEALPMPRRSSVEARIWQNLNQHHIRASTIVH
jgi:hypothetical protein